MLRFILRRLLLTFPMLLAASIVVFSIFLFTKVDPVRRLLGERAQDEALVQQMRTQWGLNDPAPTRYARFLRGLLAGDLGKSMDTNRPVAQEIRERLPASLELAGTAMLLSVGFGIVVGVAAALRKNTMVDYLGMGASLLAVSLPVFWLGLMLCYTFSERLNWLPLDQRFGLRYSSSVREVSRTGLLLLDSALAGRWDLFKDVARHLVLPAVTLAAVTSAFVARMTRSSVLEVLRQDFVRTAQAKGLPPAAWLHHVLRNAMIPVVTIIGLEIPAMLGGSVITETIFAWPGMGSFLIKSILFGDVTAVQGLVMFMTALFIMANLVVDVLYAVIDPRLRA